MRFFILVSMLAIPATAFAQPSSPNVPEKLPPTLELPADLTNALADYLALQPWHDVHQLMDALRACVQIQVVSKEGITVDLGQCHAVTKARRDAATAQDAAIATAIAKQKADDEAAAKKARPHTAPVDH